MKIFEYEPSWFFVSIKIVNPSTTFKNFPSLISEVKKSIFEFFKISRPLYCENGEKNPPIKIWKIVRKIEKNKTLFTKSILLTPEVQKISSSFLFS